MQGPCTALWYIRLLLNAADSSPTAKDPIDFLVAEGELAAVHLYGETGTPESPSSATASCLLRIYRFVGGRIAEAWGWGLAASSAVPKTPLVTP